MDEQKSRPAKAGRRAAREISVRLPKTDDSEDVHAEISSSKGSGEQGNTENTSLQGDVVQSENVKKWNGVSRRKAAQINKESDAKDAKQVKYDSDENDSILEIPEIDDEGDEDITRVVAAAPKVSAIRLTALSEIKVAASQYLGKTKDEVTDLSLLAACLCPKEEVEEWDGIWEAEQMLTDIGSQINAENSIASKQN